MPQSNLTEQDVRRIIHDELQDFINNNKYTVAKPMQFLDGRNIQFGVTTGSDLGTALHLNQNKIAFFGSVPVVQQNHIADPSGGLTADGEARTAINAILLALETYGILKSA